MLTTTRCRRCCRDLWLVVAGLSLLVACSRSRLFSHGTSAATGGNGGTGPDSGQGAGGSDGGQIPVDARPDHGADLLGPGRSDAGANGSVDAAPDRSTDRPGDSSLDAQASAEVGMLKLVAGRLGGAGALDGIGAAVRFNGPEGVAIDGKGTLFVADGKNHTIRKVVIATREVTTLAGSTGKPGSDDGIGAAARFSGPAGIAYDGAGNLLVADRDNQTIRKVVVATGEVTTLAGSAGFSGNTDGNGEDARFGDPSAVASDGAGNLFVADGSNSVIRKVVIVTGEVSTLPAVIAYPTALVCDEAGNVFVADAGTGTILQVAAATGAVTTIAGDPDECCLYTDGPGAMASFNWPTGLAYDGAGNLFVAEGRGSTIRQVLIATGMVTTLAGLGFTGTDYHVGSTDGMGADARFWGPSGVVSDGAGNLYVADSRNHAIREVVVATKTVATLVGAAPGIDRTDGVGAEARFDSPRGLAYDGSGDLFVAEYNNQTIRKIDMASLQVTTLAGAANDQWWQSRDGVGGSACFGHPTSVVSDRKGNLFVADSGSHSVQKIVVDTAAVTTLAGSYWSTGARAGFAMPTDLAYDGAGNLFVVDVFAHNICKVDTATGAVTTLALAELIGPTGLAWDGSGSLFVADTWDCTIRRVDPATLAATLLAGSPGDCGFADGTGSAARFLAPANMAADGAGNLYVSDPPNHAIRKVATATGTVTTVVGSPEVAAVVLGPLPARLNGPAGLAYVPGVGLFIADAQENAILLADSL
jgi:sugar lactone lactonase YvrE